MSCGAGDGPTCMLIVAGHLIVDPAERDDYAANCVKVVELARAAPGCLDFAITADTADHSRIDPDRVPVAMVQTVRSTTFSSPTYMEIHEGPPADGDFLTDRVRRRPAAWSSR
jgi:hypothetical protein